MHGLAHDKSELEMNSMSQLNLEYVNSTDAYSDGESELELLKLFQESSNIQDDIESILLGNPSWPLLYHLSPTRRNLLNWYPFNKHSSLLEIGGGCGALTGLFCEKVKNVTAIELTKMRSEIIYHRHRNYSNLEIIAGNLHDIKIEQKYDYVTCIGVLEYAGRFTKTENPYLDFLNVLKSYLKPAGILILAIENKFGLKYWAGAREDHTGRLFESIENYPATPDINTFGKPELIKLLNNSGFRKQDFYYPMPDYKLPLEIFSDKYRPTRRHNIRPGLLPSQDLSATREHVFEEKRASDNIIDNNMFDFFANSFLVFASQ